MITLLTLVYQNRIKTFYNANVELVWVRMLTENYWEPRKTRFCSAVNKLTDAFWACIASLTAVSILNRLINIFDKKKNSNHKFNIDVHVIYNQTVVV